MDMTFQDAVRSCLSQDATFPGRARRSEYGSFVPYTVIGLAIAGVIDSAPFGSIVPDVSLPGRVFLIAIFMPGCPRRYTACMTRERSGWCWVIPIPLIGVPVLLFWPVQPGETGPNACGPDPTMRPGDGPGQSARRVQRP